MVAFGFAGLADVASVEQKPVMGLGNDICGDVLDQLFLGLQRVFAAGGESEPFGDAEDMGVHCHGGLIPYDRADHVRRLASYALQRLQVVDGRGHLAVVDLDQALLHLYQVFGFGTRVTDGLDVLEQFVGIGIGHGFGCRVGGKEIRRHHVDALVRTLRGEHDGHEALEG